MSGLGVTVRSRRAKQIVPNNDLGAHCRILDSAETSSSSMSVHVYAAPTLPTPTAFEEESPVHSTERTPIVIDNGATDFRYGWATFQSPFVGSNAMARYKERRANTSLLLFGDYVESDAASRLATRTVWEGDVLANPEALVRAETMYSELLAAIVSHDFQEAGLDLAFLRLAVSGDIVDHPIVMSERLATPLASRAGAHPVPCYRPPISPTHHRRSAFSCFGAVVRGVLSAVRSIQRRCLTLVCSKS